MSGETPDLKQTEAMRNRALDCAERILEASGLRYMSGQIPGLAQLEALAAEMREAAATQHLPVAQCYLREGAGLLDQSAAELIALHAALAESTNARDTLALVSRSIIAGDTKQIEELRAAIAEAQAAQVEQIGRIKLHIEEVVLARRERDTRHSLQLAAEARAEAAEASEVRAVSERETYHIQRDMAIARADALHAEWNAARAQFDRHVAWANDQDAATHAALALSNEKWLAAEANADALHAALTNEREDRDAIVRGLEATEAKLETTRARADALQADHEAFLKAHAFGCCAHQLKAETARADAAERALREVMAALEAEIEQQEEYVRAPPSFAWPNMTPAHHGHVATILRLVLVNVELKAALASPVAPTEGK